MGALAAAAALLGAAPAWVSAAPAALAAPLALSSEPEALRLAIAAATDKAAPPDGVAAFYAARHNRPLWIADGRVVPEAQTVLELLESARSDGLDPGAYDAAGLRKALAEARRGRSRALAAAELATTRAIAAYAADLHRPGPEARPLFWDPEAPARLDTPAAVLAALAAAPDIAEGLNAVRRMHPIYAQLRSELNGRRAALGEADPMRGLILANMDRARALPADPGRRYILVDAAAQRLWAYDDGRPVDTMKVVVGAADAQTPAMTGLMRYANFQPYWRLMLPNPLGIYLHDTPGKAAFGQDVRLSSHGCIRLEDARRLTRWLFGPAADSPPKGPDARLDLAAPVPVYVTYLTLAPTEHGLERRTDVYGRDAALVAEAGDAAGTARAFR